MSSRVAICPACEAGPVSDGSRCLLPVRRNETGIAIRDCAIPKPYFSCRSVSGDATTVRSVIANALSLPSAAESGRGTIPMSARATARYGNAVRNILIFSFIVSDVFEKRADKPGTFRCLPALGRLSDTAVIYCNESRNTRGCLHAGRPKPAPAALPFRRALA